MQSIVKQVRSLELRVLALEQQGSSGKQPFTDTMDSSSGTIISTLEGVRQERVNAVMMQFDVSKPAATADNFFDFVEHAFDFVRDNLKILQELYNPGLIVDAAKFIGEIVILLVSTNFADNPVLASIEFIQRTMALITAPAASKRLFAEQPVVEQTATEPIIRSALKKKHSVRGLLSLNRLLRSR